MEIHYSRDGGTIYVKCGYLRSLNEMFKLGGGIWDDYGKTWLFSPEDWDRLLPALMPNYVIVDDIMGHRQTPEQHAMGKATELIDAVDKIIMDNPDNIVRLWFYLDFAGKEAIEELSLTELHGLLGYISKNKEKPLVKASFITSV
jgi:hypothetical protein